MATWYVSGDGDDSDGLTWSTAYYNLGSLCSNETVGAGDIVYFKDTPTTPRPYSANVTLTTSATAIAPAIAISVDGESTTYKAGAIEDADGGVYDYFIQSHWRFYGITFKIGDLFGVNSANKSVSFYNCAIELNSASGGDYAAFIYNGVFVGFYDTTLTFTEDSQYFNVNGQGTRFEWYGGSLLTMDPLEPFQCVGGANIDVRGVDLSIINGGSLVDGWGATSDDACEVLFSGCKFHATPPSLANDTSVICGIDAKIVNCHSGDTPYFYEEGNQSQGYIVAETSIVRGGEDPASNAFSAEMVSNANTSYYQPLRYKLADVWCSANPTIDVHISHNDEGSGTGGMFETQEFWIEIEYPTASNAAFRQWDRTNKAAPGASGSDNGTDNGTDNFTNSVGLDQQISETISGGAAGIHTVWAFLAVASKTVYVCPQIDVT